MTLVEMDEGPDESGGVPLALAPAASALHTSPGLAHAGLACRGVGALVRWVGRAQCLAPGVRAGHRPASPCLRAVVSLGELMRTDWPVCLVAGILVSCSRPVVIPDPPSALE